MAIKVIFTIQREMMNFMVINRNVFYTDRKFKSYIRCIPKPDNFINQIKMSRNKIPIALGNMFNFSEEEIKEYENAKSDDEITDIIIRDAKLKGAKLLMRGHVPNEEVRDIQFIS